MKDQTICSFSFYLCFEFELGIEGFFVTKIPQKKGVVGVLPFALLVLLSSFVDGGEQGHNK